MKKYAVHMGNIILGVFLLSASVNAGEQTVLKTKSDKENYATGVEFVRSLQKRAGEVNLDLVIQGMKDALTGEIVPFTDDAIPTSYAADGSQGAGQDTQASTAGPSAKEAPAADTPRQAQPDTQEPRVAMGNKGLSQAPNTSVRAPSTSGSVAQRGQDRNERKLRGLEMRKRSIEQGL